ncbi:hypothetical protein BST81_07820 [Leptolyngbya sp. 'hensonii']|uniref:hypothetical protein n=1 Tax=Leptolyngbya sp. 'hensonii' TaxID=1922337 RepID=UPI00094FD0D6|nr:hypothetical protein [Leptolyngbya sp. 'hensonii']OLP19107.1 hypothetical protein BST81_07820 [Leptolyngbya sp. 'hensonii']
MDIVADTPNPERYTYFFALYGRNYGHQTGLLHVQHDFDLPVRDLHQLIRQRIDDVLGEDTASCYQIFALAAPEPIPCLN